MSDGERERETESERERTRERERVYFVYVCQLGGYQSLPKISISFYLSTGDFQFNTKYYLLASEIDHFIC